jgi:tripartite-type tricarboxylate transporter receptor subunit TctC
MYAPAKTPASVVTALNAAANNALQQADVVERYAKLSLELGGGSPADLQRLQDAETARWAPIVKASGFRAD